MMPRSVRARQKVTYRNLNALVYYYYYYYLLQIVVVVVVVVGTDEY